MSLLKPSFFEWRASGLHILLLVCFVKAAVLNGFGNVCWLCWKPSFPFEDLIQKKQGSLLCVAWEFIWKLLPDGLALNQGICVGLAGPSNPIWNWHPHSGASPDSLVARVSFYLKHPVEQSFPLKHKNNWQVTNHLSLKLIMDTVRHRESFPVAPGPGYPGYPSSRRQSWERELSCSFKKYVWFDTSLHRRIDPRCSNDLSFLGNGWATDIFPCFVLRNLFHLDLGSAFPLFHAKGAYT